MEQMPQPRTAERADGHDGAPARRIPRFPLWVVSGRTTFEWLQGRHFLIGRSRNDRPEFPDGLTVLGADGDGLSMRYYDSQASNGSVRRA
jgi:hypothetical protein